ncbi:MAG TPA: tetratricopeptide repeat protein [Planctomycetota bacterium]|nr:tetratricopeptide repeat protein [Planctomycetota bacterium]
MGALFALSAVLAPSALAHGDLDKRIAEVSREIEKAPGRADLRFKRADLHRRHRDWPAARSDLADARRLDRQLADLDFLAGLVEFDAGSPAKALELLDRQLTANPNHVPAHLCRARTLVALDRPREAVRDYDLTLQVSRDHVPDHYLERARAQCAAGADVAVVLRGLDDGIGLLGPVVSLQSMAIDLELQRNDRQAAVRRIDQVLPTLPFRGPWLLRRGQVLEQDGKPAEARQTYTTALRELMAIPAARRRSTVHQELEQQLRQALEALQR